MVHRWRACTVNEKKRDLPIVMYCLGMMYKYYYWLGFFKIKQSGERNYIHNEIFKYTPHFMKNCSPINCLQYGFVIYKDKVLIHKIEVIPHIPDSMIPVDFCKRNLSLYWFQINRATFSMGPLIWGYHKTSMQLSQTKL